jgi:hypothetical protein
MNPLFGLLGSAANIGKVWVEGKVAKSKAKAEAEATIMVQSSKSAADWEAYMAKNSGNSWKDEWLTVLFSIPLVMCFIPSLVPYVRDGFDALSMMPEWYQYTLSIIVAASFGVRSAVGLMKNKGSKK